MTTLKTDASFLALTQMVLAEPPPYVMMRSPLGRYAGRPQIAYENLSIRGFLATVASKEDFSDRSEFSPSRAKGIVDAAVMEMITWIAHIKQHRDETQPKFF